MPPPNHPETEHEPSDVNIRAILGFGVGLLVVGAAIHVVVLLLFSVLSSSASRSRAQPQFPLATGQENRLPPEPRLQINPRQDLRDLRRQEDAILGGYGWIDRGAGVVRIPIDRAMRLTLERGLPGRADPGKEKGERRKEEGQRMREKG